MIRSEFSFSTFILTIKLTFLTCLVFIIVFLLWGCDQPPEKPLVASWHHIQISLPDFERSYFNYWRMTASTDSPDLRKSYIRRMIEYELVAEQYNESKHESFNAQIKKLLKQDLNRFVRRRYLQKTFQDTLRTPSAGEINKAISDQHKRLYVQNLFVRDSGLVFQLESRFQKGESFQKIVSELNPSDKPRSWDYGAGWIKWGDLELSVENQLYQLDRQQISKPIKSSLGWHIFRIDSQQVTYNLDNANITKLKQDVSHQLTHRKLVAAAAPHISKMVKKRELVVSMKTAREVWYYLRPALSGTGGGEAIFSSQKLSDDIPRNLLAEPLAWVDNEVFMVADFVDEIPALPRYLLCPNLKKAIEGAIHNKVLAEVALEAGFDEDPVVKEKIRRSEINYRYSAVISSVDSTEYLSMIDPEEYYQNNRKRFVKSIRTEIEEIVVNDRDLALDIARKIKEGESFEALAKKHSIITEQGQPIKKRWVEANEDPIGKKAAQLQVDRIFAAVKTDKGYSVIRVTDKEIQYLPYDLVKNQVKKYISQNKLKLIREELLPKEYLPGDIKYFDATIEKAFTEATNTIF